MKERRASQKLSSKAVMDPNQNVKCKIVVVGDSQCGKTALLHVFAKDCFPEVGRGWGGGGTGTGLGPGPRPIPGRRWARADRALSPGRATSPPFSRTTRPASRSTRSASSSASGTLRGLLTMTMSARFPIQILMLS
uniref:Uncharacterized protein n=1 Tax=Accipiter nisus TaxID=211598 RepID=A0A8B9MF55_9AVES